MFGFSDAEVEAELNRDDIGRDATVTPLSQRRKNAEETAAHTQPTEKEAVVSSASSAATDTPAGMPDFPKTVPQEIFQSVVKIFNESLPPFVRQSVDEKAQQKYIYDSLDESMKEYIKSLSDIAVRRTEMMYEADRNRLNREMQSIKEKSKRVADTSAEMKEQKLSAERQKRALTERVHDLEQQIDTLLAEKEQFELENKSLANKLRVVSTRQGDDVDVATDAESEARIAELSAKFEETSIKLNETTSKFEETTAKLDESKSLIEKYESDIDTLNKRCEVADAMINDLNHKASAANATKAESDNLHSKLAETETLAEKLKEENESLNEKLRLAARQLESKDEELQIANDEIEQSQTSLKLFEEALDKFEAVKKNKDEQIAALQAKVESLNATIENNLKLQIESENALRNEIDTLKRNPRPAQPESQPKKSTKAISLDESFDDINWLISTPPEGTNARTSGLTDEEFGYQEPKRSKSTDDPAQMSLF